MYTNPHCWWNLQATMFSGNQRYTNTHTKTMYDVCVHSSYPASAILALGLLKKKEEKWTILCGRQQHILGYLVLHKRILAVLKVATCTNADSTLENAIYSQISLKMWDSEEKLAFSLSLAASEMPYYMMMHVFSRSWYSCKLKYKCSLSIHNSSYLWVTDILTQWR